MQIDGWINPGQNRSNRSNQLIWSNWMVKLIQLFKFNWSECLNGFEWSDQKKNIESIRICKSIRMVESFRDKSYKTGPTGQTESDVQSDLNDQIDTFCAAWFDNDLTEIWPSFDRVLTEIWAGVERLGRSSWPPPLVRRATIDLTICIKIDHSKKNSTAKFRWIMKPNGSIWPLG